MRLTPTSNEPRNPRATGDRPDVTSTRSDESTASGIADAESFERAIVSAEPGLRRFLRGIGQAGIDEDDILQDTWSLAWDHRHEFSGRGSASGWLFRLCQTARRRALAAAKFYPVDLEDVDRDTTPGELTESQELALVELEEARLDLVEALTTRQQSMLVSRYVLGQTVDQVAVSHHCRPGTVKATVYKAIVWLRAHDPARFEPND